MFRWKVYLSKKEGDKEEKIEREFNNENQFNNFIDKNPDLKALKEYKWKLITWPDTFLDVQNYLDSSLHEDKEDIIDEMEKDMARFISASRKLLTK